MRHLILLRHAKTEKDSDTGRDQDRCLDERGQRDAPMIGRWLAEHGSRPNVALVSAAVRTRQTWKLLSSFLPKCKADFQDDLYLASAGRLLKAIQTAGNGIETLMVIGHNPGLHELAWAMVGHGSKSDREALAVNLPTAAAVLIDFNVEEWSRAALRTGTLTNFVSPRQLKGG